MRRNYGGNLHEDMDSYGDIDTTDVYYGRNASGQREQFARCRKCGFIMNKKRHFKGRGDGIGYYNTVVTL